MPDRFARLKAVHLVAALFVLVLLLALGVLAGSVGPAPAVYAAAPAPLGTAPFTQYLPVIKLDGPANLIAAAGHGHFTFRYGQEVKLDDAIVKSVQEAILAELLKSGAQGQLPPDTQKAIGDAQAMLKLPQTTAAEAIYLRGAIADSILQVAPEALVNEYAWRNASLITWRIGGLATWTTTIHPSVLQMLDRLGIFRLPPTTDYIEDCRAQGVPIPPDWAETGTAWRRQGLLSTNMLAPGDYAAVWTYNDPLVEGACIALPRGSGAAGSAAGIICQSATTGHACFWDNKLATESPERFIGWSGRTLKLAELRDGSNLASPCTACHIGNNVYLIAPDDPTWGKVLRGPLDGSVGGFTTQVLNSTDTLDGHPRYIPMSGDPPDPRWVNRVDPAPNCAGACHEMPASTPMRGYTFARMPPLCAAGGVSNCYGTP